MGKDGKKGLGMGLGALFGEEYPTAQPERAETAPDLLPIEKIEPRADQPRKRFDPEALEMLAESRLPELKTRWNNTLPSFDAD